MLALVIAPTFIAWVSDSSHFAVLECLYGWGYWQ